MKILGIDPGLHICGYAFVESSPQINSGAKLIEAGVLRFTESSPIEKRLNQIADDLDSLLKRLKPDVVAVEQLYSHYKHPRTAILMGHARGVILQKCSQAGLEVKSFSATRIKKFITGSGRASKQQMQKSVQTVLQLSVMPHPSDVADAIAAALCCANSMAIIS